MSAMTEYFTAGFVNNMTSPVSLSDNVTHFTTMFPASQQKLADDVTGAIPFSTPTVTAQQPIDWLEMLNTHISKRENQPKVFQEEKSAPPPLLVYVSAVVFSCVGIVGNGLLFPLSFRQEVFPYSYSVYLAALSICDTGVLVNYYICMILQVNSIICTASDNVNVCRFKAWLLKFLLSSSPWLLNSFSVDRYIAFVHPLKRRALCTVRNARVACSVTVLVLCAEQACLVLYMHQMKFGRDRICGTTNRISYILAIVEQALNSMVAPFILLVLNVRILVTVTVNARRRRALAPRAPMNEDVTGGREEGVDMARKLSVALLSIPIFTLLTSLPYTLFGICITIRNWFVSPLEKSGTFVKFLLMIETYTQVLRTIGYAGKFWMLIITSKSYRAIAMKMIKRQ